MKTMDFIKEWALCLIFAAAAGTLATVIIPRGSTDKTARAVIGIFVVAVICSPLSEISKSDLSVEAFADSEEGGFDNSYAEDMREQMADVFKTTLDSQIRKVASELGIAVTSVKADISVDAEYCINIHKIVVTASNSELSDEAYLSELFGEKLGVPVEIIAE